MKNSKKIVPYVLKLAGGIFLIFGGLTYVERSFSEDDPFAPSESPSEVWVAIWEKVIVSPDVYQGHVIQLDGWMKLKGEGENIDILLYKDKESMIYNRKKTSIRLNSTSIREVASRKNVSIAETFNEKYVEVWGIYEAIPDVVSDSQIGMFGSKFRIQKVEGSIYGDELMSSNWDE